MTLNEAILFCEEHECTECDVYINKHDKRTKEEWQSHTPCCVNLVTEGN